jgi:twitching motility protein PilT
MRALALDGDMFPRMVQALAQSPLFASLAPDVLEKVAARGAAFAVEPGEVLVEEGAASDCFYVILAGDLAVCKKSGDELVELVRAHPPDTVGEMGLLLREPRSATVVARSASALLRFDEESFFLLYERVPGFGLAISRALAGRVASSSRALPMPFVDETVAIDPEVVDLLPMDFLTRHRVLPVSQVEHRLTLGFVEDVQAGVLSAARELVAGMEILPARISLSFFDRTVAAHSGVKGWMSMEGDPIPPDELDLAPPLDTTPPAPVAPGTQPPTAAGTVLPSPAEGSSPRLDALLRRVVAEGCSDLHLSGAQKPRWRKDGEILEIADAAALTRDEVLELITPVMEERHRRAFDEDNDVDFAYAIPGVARFRVNLFRDRGGVGAVLRQIPAKVLTFEQLNLPQVVQRMCDNPKGLVLVTGPTGSGKSTTLAAMIDYINRNRRAHIITLEDPIEFVHKSLQCLVNQREVGSHTRSFARALKAALREDPDIVLVGEMRDLETISLALETANTGHLVFGTLHTSTAISTVDRIIDVFPPNQQSQVRAVLSDTLKGVVAQALCRRVGGGRIAALETLVMSFATANLVREGKTHQMVSAMSTSKAQGNTLLNESLAALVADGSVDFTEALTKAVDKADLARRCGKPLPTELAPAR